MVNRVAVESKALIHTANNNKQDCSPFNPEYLNQYNQLFNVKQYCSEMSMRSKVRLYSRTWWANRCNLKLVFKPIHALVDFKWCLEGNYQPVIYKCIAAKCGE